MLLLYLLYLLFILQRIRWWNKFICLKTCVFYVDFVHQLFDSILNLINCRVAPTYSSKTTRKQQTIRQVRVCISTNWFTVFIIIDRLLIVQYFVLFVLGFLCFLFLSTRRWYINDILMHNNRRSLFILIFLVELQDILDYDLVSSILSFGKIHLSDDQITHFFVWIFTMRIKEVDKPIIFYFFTSNFFLLLLGFRESKLTQQFQFDLVFNYLEEIFLKRIFQCIVEYKLLPFSLRDQLFVGLVSLRNDHLLEIIESDVIFIIDLEVCENELFLLRITSQAEIPQILDEL